MLMRLYVYGVTGCLQRLLFIFNTIWYTYQSFLKVYKQAMQKKKPLHILDSQHRTFPNIGTVFMTDFYKPPLLSDSAK